MKGPYIAIQDRVEFTMNSVDETNVQAKSQELIQILTSDLIPWFLNYLINRRVIGETNHLDAFADMLAYLSKKFSEIQDRAILVVVNAVKVILAHLPSDDYSLIKKGRLENLGRFLGLLTFVRGRLIDDGVLDMRSLLREAIHIGNSVLLYVVPFISSFFKCVGISEFPPYCIYSTRIYKVLSWLYHREGVNQQVRLEIEAMFRELKIEMIEPEEDSKIYSPVRESYISFDDGLNIAEGSLIPRRPESPQNMTGTADVISFQAPMARKMEPSDGQTIRQQMSKMWLSQFQQPGYQEITPINADNKCLREMDMLEVADTLNIQEILKGLESQRSSFSLNMDSILFDEAVKFLSTSNAKHLLSCAIIDFLSAVVKAESENAAINLIIGVVNDEVHGRCTRNGISGDLFREVENLTIKVTSSYVKKRLEEIYSTLLENHIIQYIYNVGFRISSLGEFIAVSVRKQITKKVYSFLLSLIGREVLLVVKRKLLPLLLQSHANIGGEFQPSPDPNGNVQKVEISQKVFGGQIVPSNAQYQQMTQKYLNPPQGTNVRDMFLQSGNTMLFPDIQDVKIADSDVRRQMTHIYPNSPQMRHVTNISAHSCSKALLSNRCTEYLDESQSNTEEPAQNQVQLICSRLVGFIDKTISFTSPGPTLTMLGTIRRHATNAVGSISYANRSNWSIIVACVTNSFLTYYTTLTDDAANEDLKRTHFDTLKLMCNLSSDEFIKSAVLSAWYEGVELEREKKVIGISKASVWNWKAFAELLRQNLVDLEMFDRLLSEIIEIDFSECMEFLLNLLDVFVLPTFCGPALRDILDAKFSELSKDCTQTMSTELGSIKIVAHNRAFMALNEFDLWKSIRSFERQQRSIPITVDSIRIHTSYARIRALMDWGLFDSKDVQEKFSVDNAEHQALFKEISKPQIRNKWSEDKRKLYCVLNIWHEFCKNRSSTCIKIEDCMTECMKIAFTNGTAESKEDVLQFFRALISEIVDDFTVGESKNLDKVVLTGWREVEYRLEAFGEFLALSILTVSNIHKKINKLKLLCRCLGVIGRKAICLHEESEDKFNPLPFKYVLLKFFKTLLETQQDSSVDLTLLEPVPVAFGYLLHLLRPSRVPAFQVAFLEILENDVFIKRMLENAIPAYQNVYAQLLVDVTKHVSILAQSLVTHSNLVNLYQPLYDLWNKLSCLYPTFVCEFSHYFSNFLSIPLFSLRNLVISTRCVQTSLSWILDTDALERRLDSLPDPTGYAMGAGNRLPPLLKSQVETYISVGSPVSFLEEIPQMLQARDSIAHLLQSPTKLMITAVNSRSKALLDRALYYAAVNSQNLADYGFTSSFPYIPELVSDFLVYLCILSVENCQFFGDSVGEGLITRLPLISIFNSLLKGMGDAGQYFIINCMVSQLRYLNKHTKFFAQCLLHIFKLASKDGNLRCDIVRCLLEYLFTKEPKSEGILMTCAEIFRNFECTLDFAKLPKPAENLGRVVKSICEIYIPEIKLAPQILPKAVPSETSANGKTLTPNEEKGNNTT